MENKKFDTLLEWIRANKAQKELLFYNGLRAWVPKVLNSHCVRFELTEKAEIPENFKYGSSNLIDWKIIQLEDVYYLELTVSRNVKDGIPQDDPGCWITDRYKILNKPPKK